MHSFASAPAQSRSPQRAPQPARPSIAPANDRSEIEADRAADRVADGKAAGPLSKAPPLSLNRKCDACEADERDTVHRKEKNVSLYPAAGSKTAAAVSALGSGGVPLSAADRAYFEPRFGQDFSAVRLHTHARAAAAASGIAARAYTWRNDIAFAGGEFSPGSREGRQLIAHELAHVAQQVPHLARQPKTHSRTFHDDKGGDPLDYTETATITSSKDGTYEGSVARQVVAPAKGSDPQQLTHTGAVKHIRLTPDCRIILPYKFQFIGQSKARHGAGICQDPPDATKVDPPTAAQVTAIQDRYVASVNKALNNRYAVKVGGCKSDHPCANKSLPVVIQAEASSTSPDSVIDVVNRGGRANAATLCLGSYEDWLPYHEGGHQVLGAPDEYLEEDAATIKSAASGSQPHYWGRPERVRTDLSAMDSEKSYGRFMLFHERHFRFAQVFVEAALADKGCSVGLDSTGGAPAEFRLDLGFGGAGGKPGGMLYSSLFIGAGIPLERQRRLMLMIGAQGQALTGAKSEAQKAFTAGLRIGLEAQTTPSGIGVGGGVFGSAGASYAPATSPPSYYNRDPTAERLSPYAEGGANIYVKPGMFSGGWQFQLGGEAAIGKEFSNDPNAMSWWRVGFTIGISR